MLVAYARGTGLFGSLKEACFPAMVISLSSSAIPVATTSSVWLSLIANHKAESYIGRAV